GTLDAQPDQLPHRYRNLNTPITPFLTLALVSHQGLFFVTQHCPESRHVRPSLFSARRWSSAEALCCESTFLHWSQLRRACPGDGSRSPARTAILFLQATKRTGRTRY